MSDSRGYGRHIIASGLDPWHSSDPFLLWMSTVSPINALNLATCGSFAIPSITERVVDG